ncbi:MAG: biopolymer transporter ExbD [Desertifilum sp.]|nr:biopolymer transporter ExbD [Desertifilum sp.]
MRFKSQRANAQLPEVNLIPMLNVMMAVLAFFVMISMTLTAEEGVNVQLPGPSEAEVLEQQTTPDPLIVELDEQGQIAIAQIPLSPEQLNPQIQAYLQANPQGSVFLVANPELAYEQVVQVLSQMRQVGGDRVSLAIE